MDKSQLNMASSSFYSIDMSFSLGMARIWDAKHSYKILMLNTLTIKDFSRSGIDETGSSVLDDIKIISEKSHETLEYVTNVSHLVYATSLLDTFLSDVTLFMFLLYPASMGINHKITLETLLNSSSRNDAITKIAEKRTREISYLPFVGRLEFLQKNLNLNIKIEPDILDSLAHYTLMRNVAVHDQRMCEIKLNDNGSIESQDKKESEYPIKITSEDTSKALDTYGIVGIEVSRVICTQVLKRDSPLSPPSA
jgi:hypothetical protein